MNKRTITLIIAVAVLAALGAAYALTGVKKPAADTAAEAERTPAPTMPALLTGEEDSLVKFHVEGAGRYPVTIVKNAAGEWVAAELPSLKLKQEYVNTVAKYFVNVTALQIVTENAADWNEFGLGDNAVTATGYFADGTESVLIVGDTTPTGDRCYAKIPSSTAVYGISNYVGGLMKRTYADYADSGLPEFDYANLRHIRFYNGTLLEASYEPPDPDVVTYHASAMLMSSPIAGKSIYLENFNSFIIEPLKTVDLSDAVVVAPGDLPQYESATERLSLSLSGVSVDENGAENGTWGYTFTLGRNIPDDPDYSYAFINGGDIVYKVKNADFDSIFSANIFKIMEKFINIVYINDVSTITITDNISGETFSIAVNGYNTSDGGGAAYDEIAPTINGVNVDPDKFRQFYQLFVGLSADAMIDNDGFTPKGGASMSMSLTKTDGAALTNEYYEYDDAFYAVEQGGSFNFVLSKTQMARMTTILRSLTSSP